MSIQQTNPGYSVVRTVTPRRILKQAGKDRELRIGVTLDETASYDGGHTSYEKYIRGGCLLAYSSSSGKWAPCKRTKANGAGSASASLTVDNALHLRPGDSLVIGDNAAVSISSIDYSTNIVTLGSAKTWFDNDAVYVDAFKTARGILLDDEVALWNYDKSANVAQMGSMMVAGYADQDQMLGDLTAILEDPESAEMLRHIVFDDYQEGVDPLPLAGPEPRKWRQKFLQANVTLTAADSGTEFYCTGAVTITLPSLATAGQGFKIRAIQVSDNNMTLTAPAGKLIALHNVAATSVAFSTSSQKIGGGGEITLLPDATKFLFKNMSAGANTVTVS